MCECAQVCFGVRHTHYAQTHIRQQRSHTKQPHAAWASAMYYFDVQMSPKGIQRCSCATVLFFRSVC